MALSDEERARLEQQIRSASVRGRRPESGSEPQATPIDGGFKAPSPTGYLIETMAPGERLIYHTRRHWATAISPVPVALLVSAIVLFPVVSGLGWFFFLCAVASGLASYLTYASSEFGLTNRRVIVKSGWLRRQSGEILLSKVESIQANQGIIGRMLGYGSLVIVGTGGTRESLTGIEEPLEFRRRIQSQIAEPNVGG